MRTLKLILFGLAIGAGAALAISLLMRRPPPVPDPPAVVEKVREVARLETLEVTLYKKVTFAPEPQPAGSIWGDLAGWIRDAVNKPQGKAIVFAVARIGLDVSKLGPEDVELRGRVCAIALPPLEVKVELLPGETEVIGSNLDSAQTARLLELAKRAFEREVQADRALQARARAAAEQALTALLLQVGVDRVEFVEGGRPRS
ncbi:MAG TPA: DUF4230 domain-containing protein [Anaeromyxobacteraceae bacterium]|nr:DUF4230 domain-containing protein [Anaeromyxobacteraceae bacterium]